MFLKKNYLLEIQTTDKNYFYCYSSRSYTMDAVIVVLNNNLSTLPIHPCAGAAALFLC